MSTGRTCDRYGCSSPATRTCLSDFAYLCEEHRGTDPHACTWCLSQLAACGCGRGCAACALDAGAPPDRPDDLEVETVAVRAVAL